MATTPTDPAGIEARLDRIESTLQRLERLLDHAASALPMAADAADELARSAQARGVDIDAHARALGTLVEQGSEPRTAAALGALVQRAPDLDTVVTLAAGADDHIAMGFDIADEWVRDANARGVDVHERVVHATDLLEKLTEPRTLDALGRLAAQAEKLEWVTGLAASAEDTTAMGFDIADEVARRAAGRGVDLTARALAAVEALEAVTEPKTLGALTRIAAQADRLEWVTGLAMAAEGSTAMAFDTFDEALAQAAASGIDVDALGRDLVAFARFLGTPAAAEARAALFDPTHLVLLSKVGRAVTAAHDEDPAPIGVWGVLTALSDPKIGKATAFLLAMARHLGEALETPTALARR